MTTKKPKNIASARDEPVRRASHLPRAAAKGQWLLRDAKAKLSEVIKRVHSEGPQRVTVRGAQEVVILTAEEYRRLKGEQTGQALIDALAASPLRDVDFEPEPYYPPVRDVEL
ncbi:MAG: type II toxin-antitoxin system Phd/YefM family antitoxin [Rhodomicrobium sp.]